MDALQAAAAATAQQALQGEKESLAAELQEAREQVGRGVKEGFTCGASPARVALAGGSWPVCSCHAWLSLDCTCPPSIRCLLPALSRWTCGILSFVR